MTMRTQHTRSSFLSFAFGELEVNGKKLEGVLNSVGRATCACGWDSGPLASGDDAVAAFEKHRAATSRKKRTKKITAAASGQEKP